MVLVHATVLLIKGRGVIIQGVSGSGKSDLALRLIDRGASLVADDYVWLFKEQGVTHANAPAATFGMLEVRGIGIVNVPAIRNAALALRVLVGSAPQDPITSELPTITLSAFSDSAPIAVERALGAA